MIQEANNKMNILCQLTFVLLAICTSDLAVGLDNRFYPYDFDQYGDDTCNDDRSDCEKTEACWYYARQCKKTCNHCSFVKLAP